MLVLREDPEHNGFQDITDFVRDLEAKVDYGYYEDGWMDEHASLTGDGRERRKDPSGNHVSRHYERREK